MALRILISLLLLWSMLFMPFWVSAILALVGMVYFNIFWEAVVLFLLSDVLYGMNFISFIVAVIVLITVEIVKKKLKFYD